MTQILLQNGQYVITNGENICAKILPCDGAVDTFRQLEEGAWEWHRHTEVAVDHMRMEVVFLEKTVFTMVPAISYNGNGWGTFAEYVGDRDEDGTPWSWASHRATIPACTYSESEQVSVSLMSRANDNTACSFYNEEDGRHHVVIFPEEEKPRTLQRHFWGEPFQGTMDPRQDFYALIQAVPSDGTKFRYKHLMDFAFRYFGHAFAVPRKADDLNRLSLSFCHYLYMREKDGLAGFTTGAQWVESTMSYKKHEHRYQPGWVGQSVSMANAFIWEYLRTGDKRKLDLALEAHDAWLKHGFIRPGLSYSILDFHESAYLDYSDPSVADPWRWGEDLAESLKQRNATFKRRGFTQRYPDGRQYNPIDACNLGTTAEGYFEAYDLLQKANIQKPEYLQAAIDICRFAMESQDENGSFAKAWNDDGTVRAKEGTIGCFLILPLINAYVRTGEKTYLESARRAFAFYYQELVDKGFTTAGALDTYNIDKESASPLLRVSLKLQEVTGEDKYIEASENIGWYLTTWMMHFTVAYPDDCVIGQMGYDTFGGTAVSTPHNALDQYALRDILSFLRLYELTGNIQWRERALAQWCNANQCISDGSYIVNGRLRPVGGQDEAIFHTRWGRAFVPPFTPSQWLPAWPCAFRLECLRWHDDWSFFDEGLTNIENSIN